MAVLLGIVGKPSAGKSTILNCLTDSNAKMGDYPFTTIEPNLGVAYVKVPCPCLDLDDSCNPNSGVCVDGVRFVPIELLDVAGLVPGASTGKGMGNQFLDDLRQAEGLLHVIDLSGKTDEQGNPTSEYDPSNDVTWLNEEIRMWIYHILFSNWSKIVRKLEADRSQLKSFLVEKLSGLGANENTIQKLLTRHTELTLELPSNWSDQLKETITSSLLELLFPMILVGNKIDSPNGSINFEKLRNQFADYTVVPTSGLAELMLMRVEKKGDIEYVPGSSSIEIKRDEFPELATVNAINSRILEKYGSTGIYRALEVLVFEKLNYIPVFPVEDATHLTDKNGKILPDVFLVPLGTPVKTFAGKIHSDFEKHFLHAVLAKSGRKLSGTYELEYGDVVKIVSSAK